MKKQLITFTSLSLILGFIITSCSSPDSTPKDTSSSTSTTTTSSCSKGYHKWDSGTVYYQATCKESGLKLYKCTVCGKIDEKSIPALGHLSATAWTSDSTYHWHECLRCGAPDKTAHSWKLKSTTKVSSTVTRKIYICTVCSKTKTTQSSSSSTDGNRER